MARRRRTIPYIKLIAVFFMTSALFLTIGWSAYGTSLLMGSYVNVRIPSEVRVTGFSLYGVSNDAEGLYNDYNVDFVTGNIDLPNANSTVTYEVEITNMQLDNGVHVGILEAYGLPEGLEILSWSGYSLGDKICDDINPNDCGSGAQKTFYITIGYKNSSYYNANSTEFGFDLHFDFREFHDITYNNITGNYPSSAIDGEPLSITLSNITSLELEIMGTQEYIEGIDYTYSNGVLTIDSVEEDLVITRLPSYVITYNANGGHYAAGNAVTTNDVTYVWRHNQNNVISGTEETPVNSNYVLYNWYTEPQFNNVFNINAQINQSRTVYARWIDATAEINGTFYSTITAAINTVTSGSGTVTIRLLKNTNENITINNGQKIILNLDNHTITKNEAKAIVTCKGELKLQNGTISSDATTEATINVESTGDLTLTNVTAELTNASGKQALYTAGKVLIEGTSYLSSKSKSRATLHLIAGGNVTITGGQIVASGTQNAIYSVRNTTLTIGEKDGNVDIHAITVQGANYAIDGQFNFYDGSLKGKNGAIPAVGNMIDKEPGHGLVYSNEVINGNTYEVIKLVVMNTVTFNTNGGQLLETSRMLYSGSQIGELPVPSRGGYVFVGWYTPGGQKVESDFIVEDDIILTARWSREYSAAIGGTNYYSITNAITAAPNNVQTTITLLRDVGEAVTIPAEKNIILDLATYTLNYSSAAAAIECYGTLKVTNGSVTSASNTNSSINIRMGGHAEIDGVNVVSSGKRQAVYNYGGGYVEIKGNSYISSKAIGSANGALIERGTVQNLDTGTLIIRSATIIGIEQQAVSNEGTMIIGTQDGNINTSVIQIQGNTYGIKSLVSFEFYDGTAKGITGAINGTIGNKEANSSIASGSETIDGKNYLTQYLVAN